MNRICTRLASAVLMFGLAITTAQASELLFACTTTNGKQIMVTDHGQNFGYRFGKPGKPELAFTSDRQQTEITACTASNGDGSEASIHLSNGDYDYVVTGGGDRYHKQPYGDVKVMRSGSDTPVATLQCRTGTVVNHIFDLSNIASRCD